MTAQISAYGRLVAVTFWNQSFMVMRSKLCWQHMPAAGNIRPPQLASSVST